MYEIKKHRNPPVQSMHIIHSDHFTKLPDECGFNEDGTIKKEGAPLTDPKVCSTILCNYSKLRQNC